MATPKIRATLKTTGFKTSRASQRMTAAGEPDTGGDGTSAPTVRCNNVAADAPAASSDGARRCRNLASG
eukprot:8359547-Heterocapsa_arctica.AAC.1